MIIPDITGGVLAAGAAATRATGLAACRAGARRADGGR